VGSCTVVFTSNNKSVPGLLVSKVGYLHCHVADWIKKKSGYEIFIFLILLLNLVY
jgi:hypothetical protein